MAEKLSVPVVEIEQLKKQFPVRKGLLGRETLVAVDMVSFSIYEGETLGLVGESGCGKTTVGRCVLRLLDVDGGKIRFRGAEIQDCSEQQFRPYRKHIQMVFQNPLMSFDPLFTIKANLFESLQLRANLSRGEKEREVSRLLEQVGLRPEFAELKPHQMSGGQLQRVALARALATEPQLVFLDEPTSSLDMSIRGQIVNLLLDIQASTGMSYLFVAHDLRVIQFVANRVLVMYLGQIVEEASKEEVFQHPMHPYTRGLLASTLIGRKERRAARESSRLRGEVLQVEAGTAGCRLYNRCGYAMDRCRATEQVLVEARPRHWVRCWRVSELWRGETQPAGSLP